MNKTIKAEEMAKDIIQNKHYKLTQKGKLSFYSINVDNNTTQIFITETENPSLEQLEIILTKTIKESISNLDDFDVVRVSNWHVERADDANRQYTTKEQELIKKYGYHAVSTTHKVLLITNKNTGDEYQITRKLRKLTV